MKKAIIFVMLLGIFLFGTFIAAYFLILSMPSDNTETKALVIKDGDNIDDISQQLKNYSLIKSKLIFKIYLFVNQKVNKIQPGEYFFKQTTIPKIVERITPSIEGRKEISITFLEGWTSSDMAKYLEDKGIIFQDEFIKLSKETDTRKFLPNNKYSFFVGKPLNANIEGFLFPDTYRIFEDSTAVEIIERMLDNFDVKLTQEMRQEIQKQNKEIYDIVTLASIVEKEAKTKEDKKVIAGIFWNRLAIDKKLESDATINYVTGKKTTRPTYSDLESESLYNTYKYRGLPPGPICNPGLDSIMAVIYPTETDYMFFLNTPSGSVIYSKTGEEHIDNKNKYYPD